MILLLQLAFLFLKMLENNDKFVLFEPLNMYDVIFINDDHQKIIVKKHGVTKNEFTSLEKLYVSNLFNDLFSNKVCKLPTATANKAIPHQSTGFPWPSFGVSLIKVMVQ